MKPKRKETRREKIKAAALELFAAKGYHSTSTNMIIDSAGVSKGLLFFHFPAKEDLLKELMIEWMERIWQESVPERNEQLSPQESLDTFLDGMFSTLVKYEKQYRLYYSLMLTDHPLNQAKDLAKLPGYRRLRTFLRWMFKRLGVRNGDQEFQFFSMLVLGYEMRFLITPRNRSAEFRRLKEQLKYRYRSASR